MATPSLQPAPLVGDVQHPHHDEHPDQHKEVKNNSGEHGQQTPPNSADGKKTASDGVPSELSDLDLEQSGGQDQHFPEEGSAAGAAVEEEVEDIEPDHYYGGGKIPVFKPTMDQFRDFAAFVRKVDKYGMQSGVVKIIPPQEWRDSLHALDDAVKTIKVKNPIVQEFHGSHGTYTQANIEKQRSYNLPQWKSLCEEGSHQPPARRGQRRRVTDRPTRSTTAKQNADAEKQKAKSTKPEGPPTPVSPDSKPVEVKPEELSDGESLPPPKKKGRQPKSVSSRRKHNRGDAADYVDEEAFEGFDYRIHDNQDYTAERCEELETAYWKSLMYNNPIYGADMPGSLFEDKVESWNVAKLPNLLDVLGQKVPGVNTAYLYLGMWKATFAWHLEDVDLYSINYIHFGAPKQWYSISQEDIVKFENAMKNMWPTDAKNCDQFLRHKTYLVSPSILKSQYGVTVNRMVHYEGEFVITFPYGYHSGYNLGYNCAESVNFATEKWLNYGRIAKKCHCESDSVWIDVDEIERKMRGEVTPEYYPEVPQPGGASDLLTPPRSVPEKAATRVKKRKRDGEETKTKRVKLVVEAPRKIPCLLCPNDYDFEELLPTEDGKSQVHRRCAMYIEETNILKDDNGNEVVCDVDRIPKARMGLKCMFCREVRGACFQCNFGKCTRSYHATCAVVAGVQVEFGQVIVIAGDGKEYSTPGVDLRCKYHRPKRACNLPGAGLERDRDSHGLAPKVDFRNFGNLSEEVLDRYGDRTEVVQKPRKFNNVAGWVLDRDPEVNQLASKLEPNHLVQFEFEYSKDPYGAVVLENRVAERMLKVRVLPKGGVIELNYRHLIPVKKSCFNSLPAGIQPLPDNLARKPGSQNDLAFSQPVIGTPFSELRSDLTWAEFECTEPPVNLVTAKFDFSQPEKLWYYLGKTSTDSKAQYTDNPQVPVHNPRSQFLNFLKTIQAPTLPTYQPHHRYRPTINPLGQTSSSSSTARLPAFTTQASSSGLPDHHKFGGNTPANRAANYNSSTFTGNQYASSDHYRDRPKELGYSGKQPEFPTPESGGPPGPADFQTLDLHTRSKILEIVHRTNVYANYNVVKPEFLVQFLLGPIEAPYRQSRFPQLKSLLERTPIYKKGVDNNLLPPQKIDMGCREVVVMLRALEKALTSHFTRQRELERQKTNHEEWVKRLQKPMSTQRSVFDRVNFGKSKFLDSLLEKTPEVYKSPYTEDGYADWALEEYGVVDKAEPTNNESLANSYFEQLTPEDQDKVTQECGSFVAPPPVDMDTNMNLDPYEDTQGPMFGPHPEDAGFNVYNVGPQRTFSPLGPSTLHADSPTSYPSRVTSHYQSMHQGYQDQDQDLFGDQQANQRFWTNSTPWIGTNSGAGHDDGQLVMFGPHERPRHDYASSDMDGSRGPGSLHSMDMAGFGPEPDGNYPDLSP